VCKEVREGQGVWSQGGEGRSEPHRKMSIALHTPGEFETSNDNSWWCSSTFELKRLGKGPSAWSNFGERAVGEGGGPSFQVRGKIFLDGKKS